MTAAISNGTVLAMTTIICLTIVIVVGLIAGAVKR